MPIRKIKIVGDKVLRKKTEPVSKITPDIKQLIADMFETMDEAKGIGLAAPQVGVSKRIIVINVPVDENIYAREAYINPEIIYYSDELEEAEEGCLSVPGVCGKVTRPSAVKVRAIDAKKKSKITFDAEGLLARCIMHEIDHLNGKLFIDEAGISEADAIKISKAADKTIKKEII